MAFAMTSFLLLGETGRDVAAKAAPPNAINFSILS
jgi:hypothetical protein